MSALRLANAAARVLLVERQKLLVVVGPAESHIREAMRLLQEDGHPECAARLVPALHAIEAIREAIEDRGSVAGRA